MILAYYYSAASKKPAFHAPNNKLSTLGTDMEIILQMDSLNKEETGERVVPYGRICGQNQHEAYPRHR